MNKIKAAVGFLMMLSALTVSERLSVFIVYIIAAAIHEAGHLIAAKALKINVKGVGFDYSGLRINIDDEMTPYASEIALAVAGPISNIVSACIGCSILKHRLADYECLLDELTHFIDSGEASLVGSCAFFIVASCVQATINLLPVKTFDGGRILYCLLAMLFDEGIAEKVLSFSSSLFAFVLWTVSLYLMIQLSRGLGIYIFAASIFAITLKDKKIEQ